MSLIKNISPSILSDSELVELYKRSNRQHDLAQLFLRYSDLVYGCCIKYLTDQEKAKDAVMSIYQELVEKLKTHKVENFKSWLYVLTKNYCLMQLRKSKKNALVELPDDLMQSGDFLHLDNALAKEEQLVLLENCVQQLNAEQRRTVELFYFDNKCYNEITALTGNDWNKVKSLVQNARRNP